MDKLVKHLKLTTYKFTVGPKTFEIAAKNRSDAFEAANSRLWGDLNKLVKSLNPNNTSFAWFDGAMPNTFYWQADVFLD